MSFGRLSPIQAERVAGYVRGRRVHDLGSGDDFDLARALLGLGAKEVIAIDTYPAPRLVPNGIRYIRNYFENIEDESVDVAFISWPSNRPNQGLIDLIRPAPFVIYLGNCMDGTMCGSPEFYRYLATRKVLEHAPERKNTLVVYGREGAEREMLLEEIAGSDHSRIHVFEGER